MLAYSLLGHNSRHPDPHIRRQTHQNQPLSMTTVDKVRERERRKKYKIILWGKLDHKMLFFYHFSLNFHYAEYFIVFHTCFIS